MQLLNIALGIVIVLVYVNAESTAPEKPVELSITPAKAIPVPDETDKILPYVVKKYFEVTGGKEIKSIQNRTTNFLTGKYNCEKFDAFVTDSSVFKWMCYGIEYWYPFQLLDDLEHEQHPIEQEITKMIKIVDNGTCLELMGGRNLAFDTTTTTSFATTRITSKLDLA
uniref:Uncharacterized protein n=1 Tax=Cacopsylla melanoneura TaxID=428564 RepID=A0A8D9EVR3_9HEMI